MENEYFVKYIVDDETYQDFITGYSGKAAWNSFVNSLHNDYGVELMEITRL